MDAKKINMIPDVTLHDKTFEVYIPKKRIASVVLDMVDKVAHEIGDVCPIFVGVLNGSFLFMSDFVRHYPYNCEISFLKMASYQGTGTTGKVKTLLGVNEDFSGRTVVILEDIVDTGNTLEELYRLFEKQGVKDFRVATLFFKPDAYTKKLPVHYVGMEIENKFIVGYGLDYDGLGRNLPHIYKLKGQTE